MESSTSGRVEKRRYEDESDCVPESKKAKLPALASVIVEALKVDSLQRLCSSLEPLLRKIVSDEVERALTKLSHATLAGRSSPLEIEGPKGENLQLHFKTRMPPHLFTGGKVEGEQGAAIHVVLIDQSTGSVVQTGLESAAKLNVVVLEGDFNEEMEEDWTKEKFESHEVKEREGKRPLLTGDLQVSLKEGRGTLGELTFTDNSSWIRSRKFRLGVKFAPGYCEGVHVREAKTEAFFVKDHRGELYKKHYPPALHDEVWRLDRIAKDGALHKKLLKAEIVSVEDFLRLLIKDPQKLRNILGSGMSSRMWENTVDHAKTCVLGGKLYVYYTDRSQSTGVVFNNIYELRGLIANGQFLNLESLTNDQKLSVDSLVKRAYENWHQVVEYNGKILNSLASTKKGAHPLAASTGNNNHDTDHFNAIYQQRQQYISTEQSPLCQAINGHPSITQMIEFPHVRTNETSIMTLNNPQAALSGSMDYMSLGVGSSYLSGDWSSSRPRNNGEGFENYIAEEVRISSSEMLESDEMQRLLKSYSVGAGVMTPGFNHPDDGYHSYSNLYEPRLHQVYEHVHHSKGSGKAVVGWLKLKAALRWGIFIRKRAAERRAQLVELN